MVAKLQILPQEHILGQINHHHHHLYHQLAATLLDFNLFHLLEIPQSQSVSLLLIINFNDHIRIYKLTLVSLSPLVLIKQLKQQSQNTHQTQLDRHEPLEPQTMLDSSVNLSLFLSLSILFRHQTHS